MTHFAGTITDSDRLQIFKDIEAELTFLAGCAPSDVKPTDNPPTDAEKLQVIAGVVFSQLRMVERVLIRQRRENSLLRRALQELKSEGSCRVHPIGAHGEAALRVTKSLESLDKK